ncbi:MAG: DNA translocase FtsK, partial [Patescibacteria group bacterium]
MAKKKHQNKRREETFHIIHPEAKSSIVAVFSLGLAVVFVLSGFHGAGPVGEMIFNGLTKLMGLGYYLLPATLIAISISLFTKDAKRIVTATLFGGLFVLLSSLGIIDVLDPGQGGWLGEILGSLNSLFGYWAALTINFTILLAALIATFNTPIKLSKGLLFGGGEKNEKDRKPAEEPKLSLPESPGITPIVGEHTEATEYKENKEKENRKEDKETFKPRHAIKTNYVFPPLSLLKSTSEKPTVGDLKANANIIKRTLESFGMPVEMGEITIGPKVTRYTLKPAEGVKLSRITALNQDLALALATHPIRIEAPIPGKSLVGIEVPNKVGSIVRLGGLLNYSEFANSPSLCFPLGRDVSGDPIFTNLSKMPHLLIAGSTGSGKSVAIHSLLISLLYKNSPETLRLILIDPKRVELSVYEGLPHLVSSVITDGKKAVAALRFGVNEMERRYEVLLKAGCRDITSYNDKKKEDLMPYLVIVIDELADLMISHGRDVEGLSVRLAQMARATGIHLIVSTQRPSVEVITGLIKANITSRIALQVASQIDSRTILDMAGAEKLLGGGDMLFISGEISKPRRIQGTYVTDEEIKKVADFITQNNLENPENLSGDREEGIPENNGKETFSNYMGSDDDDDLFDEALEVVKEAQKASASLLQRRLKVGYARAARLLDIMESKNLIGPGEGAKPREV